MSKYLFRSSMMDLNTFPLLLQTYPGDDCLSKLKQSIVSSSGGYVGDFAVALGRSVKLTFNG
jgi:hypothetical protein